MNNKTHFILETACILVIVVSSFAIRWYKLESLPAGIEYDEVSWIATSLFNKHHILALEKGLWEMNDSVATSFPLSLKINELGFLVFGKDIYSARKILAIFSVLSLATFYLLCRRFFNLIVSFCITILYSFSTYKLIISRIAVEPAYADLFLYLFIALILLISQKNGRLNYVYSSIAVAGIILGTFTYSLSFFFPALGVILLILQLISNRLKLKEKIIIFLIFIIPLTIVTPKWFKNIRLESERKSYALGEKVIDLEKKRFNSANFYTNINLIRRNLFKRLAYRTADMVVSYENTIIPQLIVYLALAGFLLSLFKIKRYYPIQIWFGLSFVPMIFFGLTTARMWINIVGAFFIFSGIATQLLVDLKEIKNNKFTPFFLYFFTLFVVYLSLYEYYKFALDNPAFSPKIAEIVKLSREFKGKLTSDIAFISDEEFNQGTIYPVTTFYYLAEHPEEENRIRYMTRNEMQVFTYDTFIESAQYNLYKYVVVDNNIKEEISNLIQTNIGGDLKEKPYKYFSLLEL